MTTIKVQGNEIIIDLENKINESIFKKKNAEMDHAEYTDALQIVSKRKRHMKKVIEKCETRINSLIDNGHDVPKQIMSDLENMKKIYNYINSVTYPDIKRKRIKAYNDKNNLVDIIRDMSMTKDALAKTLNSRNRSINVENIIYEGKKKHYNAIGEIEAKGVDNDDYDHAVSLIRKANGYNIGVNEVSF